MQLDLRERPGPGRTGLRRPVYNAHERLLDGRPLPSAAVAHGQLEQRQAVDCGEVDDRTRVNNKELPTHGANTARSSAVSVLLASFAGWAVACHSRSVSESICRSVPTGLALIVPFTKASTARSAKTSGGRARPWVRVSTRYSSAQPR